MTELKPCPFCGGEAEAREQGGVTYIACLSCFAQTLGKYGKQRAIAEWNTRAERTCEMEPVWGTNALQCSECSSYVSTWDAECEIGKINYCPNCGRRVVDE